MPDVGIKVKVMAPVLEMKRYASFATLFSEQKALLATLSYQDKKKKHDQKVIMQESDKTLV